MEMIEWLITILASFALAYGLRSKWYVTAGLTGTIAALLNWDSFIINPPSKPWWDQFWGWIIGSWSGILYPIFNWQAMFLTSIEGALLGAIIALFVKKFVKKSR
jgi:hypothetical protein